MQISDSMIRSNHTKIFRHIAAHTNPYKFSFFLVIYHYRKPFPPPPLSASVCYTNQITLGVIISRSHKNRSHKLTHKKKTFKRNAYFLFESTACSLYALCFTALKSGSPSPYINLVLG